MKYLEIVLKIDDKSIGICVKDISDDNKDSATRRSFTGIINSFLIIQEFGWDRFNELDKQGFKSMTPDENKTIAGLRKEFLEKLN